MTDLRATYRLQLHAGFGFRDALAVVPYLRDLGISHLYLSPSMTARPGSMHGYDVVDPNRLSDELGGEEAFRELAAGDLGIVLDIVPNHLAVGDVNPWWADESQRAKVFDYDPETGWYRRFFDIDDLGGVRQEDPAVFDLTHAKVRQLLADGLLDGLRVDHPDGLADPAGYLERLHGLGAPRVWVEKILHPGEPLRDWPVSGTVGYEFLADTTTLYVDPAGEEPLTALYEELSGETRSFPEIADAAQHEMASATFHREVARLAALAAEISPLPPDASESVVADAVATLPVYRTYVDPEHDRVELADREAVAAADMPAWLAAALLLDEPAPAELVTRFQQTTPPVTAEGVEDTGFYRYNRLLALNEVGGDPGRFALSVDDFHAANRERLARFPEAMLAATTHDTKRSLDIRSRLAVLAGTGPEADDVDGGLLDAFDEHVRRWFEVTEPLVVDGVPGPNERWYLFQTLLGAWPITADRLSAHLEKAFRETKVHTTWIAPDEEWERRTQGYARAVLDLPGFLDDFVPLAERVARAGEVASIGQTLLRVTAPGVPDTYQGDEELFLALVDPDNRRPLDWAPRRADLARLRGGAAPTRRTAKLHVLHQGLMLRRRRPEPFTGAYRALEAGPHTVGYVRGDDDIAVAVGVRRDPGASITLPRGGWRELLRGRDVTGGEPVSVAELTGPWRAALLERG